MFGCLCEVSSIFGHIAYVKGVRVKIDIKRMGVAIIRRKSEALAEILDEGIESIDDGTRKHHARHPRYGGQSRQMDDIGVEDCDIDNYVEPENTEEDNDTN